MAVIDRIIRHRTARTNHRLWTPASRMARVNIIIRYRVPVITIRSSARIVTRGRPRGEPHADPVCDFLRAGVQLRLNMVISGGTGTGDDCAERTFRVLERAS